jgi:23S rRNA pseudouridine1911/1915/1917 synthase
MKSTGTKKISITGTNAKERLDVVLAVKLDVSRSQVHKYIDRERVLVNGLPPLKYGVVLQKGDKIVVSPEQNQVSPKVALATLPNINIKAETDDYVVIEKPAGVLVHPTEAKENGTIAHWFVKKYPKSAKVGDSLERPGIVHRLDKEASGLLVLAKTQKMFDYLKKQFTDRTIEKEYLVLVYNEIDRDHVIIDFPIDRGVEGRMVARSRVKEFKLKHVDVELGGKDAITELFVEKRFSARFTLLRVHIHTGRTHQIRVHCFAYGNPVVGDTLYMNKSLIKKNEQSLDRLFLHAHKLSFNALSGERVSFESALPSELKAYLQGLEKMK